MSFIKAIHNLLITFFGESKISHLNESIRLSFRHFVKERVEPLCPIRNQINMQICDHSQADLLRKRIERIH